MGDYYWRTNEIYIHLDLNISLCLFGYQYLCISISYFFLPKCLWQRLGKIIQMGEESFCCRRISQVQEASILESLNLRNNLAIHCLPKHICDSHQYLISGFIFKGQFYGLCTNGTLHKVRFLSLKAQYAFCESSGAKSAITGFVKRTSLN